MFRGHIRNWNNRKWLLLSTVENEYSTTLIEGAVLMDSRQPPQRAEEFRTLLLERYDRLSKRLQQVARYVLDEPNELALETLAVIAERCGVQPSAIVRFAKSFGFSGASQMQRLFRDGLLSANAALGYGERVRRFSEIRRAGRRQATASWPNSSRAMSWRSQNLERDGQRAGNARGRRPDRQGRGRSMSRASAAPFRSRPISPIRCSSWASTSSSSTASAAWPAAGQHDRPQGPADRASASTPIAERRST